MVVVSLQCAIVGQVGSSFDVDIDASQLVGDLKNAIKAKNATTITGDAKDLQLFLAKQPIEDESGNEVVPVYRPSAEEMKEESFKWLPDEHRAALKLVEGESDDYIHALTAGEPVLGSKTITTWFYTKNNMELPSSEQVHVLVVVPEQGSSVPTVSQDGVFDHCSDPFFLQLPTVDQVGDWLEFSSLLPLTRRQKLYIRSSYQVIANQALLNPNVGMVKYAVVTGTPGVGKSVFVYYVLWRLIKEKKRVLLFDNNGLFYFDGSMMLNCLALPSKFNLQFWSPDLWCLVDSMDPTSISGLPYRLCSLLLASAPRRDCIGEFKKQPPTADVFYMPLWSKEELATIAPMYPHAAAVWENRFDCLGGVPRLVLQDIGTNAQALLMSACSSCSLDDCTMLVSIHSKGNSKTTIAQTLIHILSQEPYREYEVVYASDLAMQLIVRTKWRFDRARLQSLLGWSYGKSLAQSLCGYIFEFYSMDRLEQGGTFVYRELFSGKRKRTPADGTIDIPRSSQPRQVAERVEVGQHANQLYVPGTSNYTAIDAWMPQFGGFQMTVGKTHDIKSGAANDLAKLGQNGNRLFFLLPPLYYKTFTKKTPQTIKQYAILVPYPRCVMN
ncbi:Crinkler (CRN) family protein [Phytophthora infestans T30-4]|uniref:Crinkler (CRN) family protein n=3 Tax=Phytophthora infestans TaxID=4787 RepID=D0MVZ7_PHYIT|nr:Crinkler (CRN) family protein [Phytophthora infestans T30-4]EEY63810.1 Crinkler (CRN) family protein [Phytophthora infestans T30-4]|eukprot:XP_002907246.1 Crinkler (CRN) family protein [Phytophthora infestans T30-4]